MFEIHTLENDYKNVLVEIDIPTLIAMFAAYGNTSEGLVNELLIEWGFANDQVRRGQQQAFRQYVNIRDKLIPAYKNYIKNEDEYGRFLDTDRAQLPSF